MIRIVLIFLAVMAAIAVLGGFRRKRRIGRDQTPKQLNRTRICPHCARIVVGSGPCDCGRE